MRPIISHLGGTSRLAAILPLLVLCGSGCCVSHSLSIKNNTGAFVTVAAKDTGQGVGIPSGKQQAVPFWGGPMVVITGSNMWFYPKIAYEDHPEARHRVFHFGICQAGFGYFVTRTALEPDGRLTVGHGAYEPERRTQW
jgi:hypothetical protein